MPPDPAWLVQHRRVWQHKAALRCYYTEEIFRRIKDNMSPGPSLEIGAGPGYLAQYLRDDIISTDITAHSGVSVCADAHHLPFPDRSFQNVVGVDVLHHFARPSGALREMVRVLCPGGRIALIEPWTGALSIHFFRLLHQESCVPVPDPWEHAMPPNKQPMDGNTIIPKLLLVDRAEELRARVPGLKLLGVEPFGILSYFLTGGFQSWGGPLWASRLSARIERLLPDFVTRGLAVRVFFSFEKRV
jgi:SAM-dependent methyltransferase